METTPQPKKQGRIYAIIGTLAWMVLAFIAGIYVGIHPEWVPNMPWAYHPSVDQMTGTMPHFPTTQATTDNSMVTPQTEPSPEAH